MRLVILSWIFFAILLTGCNESPKFKTKHEFEFRDNGKTVVSTKGAYQTGRASYYAKCFNGRRTASGERCDLGKMTAAHRTLPFGTMVKVTALATGRSVVVRVNDRGPFSRKRVIDISYAAAKCLGMTRAGVARVKLDIVKPNKRK